MPLEPPRRAGLRSGCWPRCLLPPLLFVALGACAGTPPPATPDSALPADWRACTEPRPQVCTREYRPVCASRDTGKRCVTTPCDGTTEWITRPNACDACTDPAVTGLRPGACEQEGAAPPAGATQLPL